MDKSKMYGLLMCVAAAVVGWIFLSGIVQGKYWSLAVPVFAAVAGICVLAFWIGLTIVTTKTEEPYIEEPASTGPEAAPPGEPSSAETQDRPSESEAGSEGAS